MEEIRMANKRSLERRIGRRIIPWHEELRNGILQYTPYAALAAAAAVVGEQWTASQSLLADVGVAIPTAAALVTLEALAHRFSAKNEQLIDKIQRRVIAGILGAGVYGVTYLAATSATEDAKEAGYMLAGTLLGYLGVKAVKLAKPKKVTTAGLALAALLSPAFINYNPHEATTKTEVVAQQPTQEEKVIVEEMAQKPAPEIKKPEETRGETSISYTASPPFTIWPVDTKSHEIISCFGYRGYGIAGGNGTVHHPGIDIDAKFGTPVLAAANGIVSKVDPNPWGMVSIYHGNHRNTTYLHMSKIEVRKGQKVEAGEEIGLVGEKAPYKTVPHLHFEVQDGNISRRIKKEVDADAIIGVRDVNPLCYLRADLDINIWQNLGCNSQGGWDKFCLEYTQYTEAPDALDATRQQLLALEERYGSAISAAGDEVPILGPYLLISMIQVESGGMEKRDYGKPHAGVLQVSRELGVKYGLCDNKMCSGRDDRGDPAKEIHAAAAYIGLDLMPPFMQQYPMQADEFTLAAYNGGSGLVRAAIAKTKKEGVLEEELTWEDVAERIDADLVCRTNHWISHAKCARKAKVIKDYVTDVLWYQAILEDNAEQF